MRDKYPRIVDFYPLSCTNHDDYYRAEFERFRRDFMDQLQAVGMHGILFTRPHFAVLEAVRMRSPTETFLPSREFANLCKRYGVAEKGELDRDCLLDLLDKLGVIIYFPKLPWLDSYLLNPRWLTYGVYTLLYADQARQQLGRLKPTAVLEILRAKTVTDNLGHTLNYAAEHCRFILDALEQFEIGYRLPNNELMIPALLPSDTPKHGFDKSDALAFDFDFGGFLPRHLMPGFIVRRHQEIDRGTVWQNGVRLRSTDKDAEALAQADYHERRLSLWVRGPQASRYFSALHDDVMQMLTRMPDLKFKEWVRLPGGAAEQRAGFRHLLALETAGQRRYICEYGDYDLAEVLRIMPTEDDDNTKRETHINAGRVVYIEHGGARHFTVGDNAPVVGELQQLDERLKDLEYSVHVEVTDDTVRTQALRELAKIREALQMIERGDAQKKHSALDLLSHFGDRLKQGAGKTVEALTAIKDGGEALQWLIATVPTVVAALSHL